MVYIVTKDSHSRIFHAIMISKTANGKNTYMCKEKMLTKAHFSFKITLVA